MTGHDITQHQSPQASYQWRGKHWRLTLFLLLALFAGAGQSLRVAVISDLNGDYGSASYESAVVGTNSRSARSFTFLVFTTDAIHVDAYPAPDFQTPLDWSSLPEAIHSSSTELLRADLVQGVAIRPGTATSRQTNH